MSFGKRLTGLWRGRTALAMALVGVAVVAAPGIAGAWTFDQTLGVWRESPAPASSPATTNPARPLPIPAKTKAVPPTPVVEHVPTSVEIVNKAINPGALDPNVPLPHPGLTTENEPSGGNGPRLFGRGEQGSGGVLGLGGGIFGVRVPIPAERGPGGTTARYGSGQAGSESAQ